jgi:hypothetical protein
MEDIKYVFIVIGIIIFAIGVVAWKWKRNQNKMLKK